MKAEMRSVLPSAGGIIDGLKGETERAAAFGLAAVPPCLKNPAKAEPRASMTAGRLFERGDRLVGPPPCRTALGLAQGARPARTDPAAPWHSGRRLPDRARRQGAGRTHCPIPAAAVPVGDGWPLCDEWGAGEGGGGGMADGMHRRAGQGCGLRITIPFLRIPAPAPAFAPARGPGRGAADPRAACTQAPCDRSY